MALRKRVTMTIDVKEHLSDLECTACGADLQDPVKDRVIVPQGKRSGFMVYAIVCDTPECLRAVV